MHNVKKKVQVQQSKYNFHADKKWNVTNVEFRIEDWVRAEKPGFVTKGHRYYSDFKLYID